MISKAVVFVGALLAAGAGYASAEFVDVGPKPVRRHVRGGFRGGEFVARIPTDAPVAPAAVKAGGEKSGIEVSKPGTPAGTTAQKPEPVKPAVATIPVRNRVVKDVKLPVAANSREYALKSPREVHVDPEHTMTWYGEEGKTLAYRDLKHLGADLRGKNSPSFVIVAATDVSWQQLALMIVEAQNNYTTDIYLGVAKADAPETLRILPIPQTPRSDDPMPEGTTFHVVIDKKPGEPQVSIDGKKIEKFPEDLATAWNEWKKANPDSANTAAPEETRVIVEAPRGAPAEQIVRVIDVLRGLGIQSERYAIAAPMRALK